MKKLIIICLITLLLVGFTGCKSIEENAVESVEDCGFIIIEELGKVGYNYTYLVYDKDTGVEYIYTSSGTYNRYSVHSFCPYYDENGNVVIYKGE